MLNQFQSLAQITDIESGQKMLRSKDSRLQMQESFVLDAGEVLALQSPSDDRRYVLVSMEKSFSKI